MASLPLVASILGDRYGVTVNIGGENAYTDGKIINLPTLPLDCSADLLALAKGYCDHEAAHIRHTDFAALKAAKLTPLQKHLWNMLEDHMVEQKLAALFPGCRQHFRWLIQHHFGKDNSKAEDSNPALSFLNWTLLAVRAWEVPEIAAQRDAEATAVDKAYPGLRAKLGAILSRVRQQCRNTSEAIGYALELSAVIEAYAHKSVVPQKDTASTPKMSTSQKGEKENGSTDSLSQSEEAADTDSQAQGEPPLEIQLLTELLTATDQDLPMSMGEQVAAILSAHHGDSIHSLTVAQVGRKCPLALHDDIKQEILSATVALRTRLHGLMQAKVQRACTPGRRGKLDPQRLYALINNNPRVFLKRGERKEVATAVHLLLDASGSMHGARMELAARACYGVAVALERVGVNVGVTVFPASPAPDGSDNTVAPLVRHGERVHDRFSLHSGGGTPLAAAMWWIMQQMMPLKEPRKIICMLSDGQPDSLPAAQHALKQARVLGFEIMGLGIQDNHMACLLPPLGMPSRTIHELAELAPAMFGMLQQALLGQGGPA